MITLVADSDARGRFVSLRYREDDPSIYSPTYTIAWLDDEGCELTVQYHVDTSTKIDMDYNKRVLVLGVDTV